ncbi:copper-transporting ATPase HMA4-like protein [Tanacetum coccineum]
MCSRSVLMLQLFHKLMSFRYPSTSLLHFTAFIASDQVSRSSSDEVNCKGVANFLMQAGMIGTLQALWETEETLNSRVNKESAELPKKEYFIQVFNIGSVAIPTRKAYARICILLNPSWDDKKNNALDINRYWQQKNNVKRQPFIGLSRETLKVIYMVKPSDADVVDIKHVRSVDQGTRTIKFKIGGIECASCSISIESVLKELNGVESVVSSLDIRLKVE